MSKEFSIVCLCVVALNCDVPEVSDARVAPPPAAPAAATPVPMEQPAVTAEPTSVAEVPASPPAEEPAPPPAEDTAAPVAEEDTEGEDPFEGWWQLADDSVLTAKFERTPPILGLNRLMVELTTDDFEQKFAGTIEYRTSQTEQSDEKWNELVKVSEDENGTYYLAEIVIPPEGAYVQFHIKDVSDEQFYDLTDWQVKVPK